MSGPTSEPALKQIAPQRFTAPIYRVGANCCVDAPPRVSRAFGTGRYVAVVGTANGFEFRTTLVPRGGGLHRLFLNGDVRAAAGVGEGDSVTVRLAFDAEPREVPVAEDVSAALRALPGASDVFRGFTRKAAHLDARVHREREGRGDPLPTRRAHDRARSPAPRGLTYGHDVPCSAQLGCSHGVPDRSGESVRPGLWRALRDQGLVNGVNSPHPASS